MTFGMWLWTFGNGVAVGVLLVLGLQLWDRRGHA